MSKKEESQVLIDRIKEAAEETIKEMDIIKKEKNISNKELDRMLLENKHFRENSVKLIKEIKKLFIHLVKNKIINEKKKKEISDKIDYVDKSLAESSAVI